MPDDDTTNVVTLHPARANPDAAKPKKRKVRKIDGPMSGEKAITAEQKAARAIELRLRGYSLQQIADEVGYADPSGAFRAIMRGLAAELPEAQRDQLRRLEIAKLNTIEASSWPAATRGLAVRDSEGEPVLDENGVAVFDAPDEKAQAIVLRCIDRRSKLLGLDAPVQVALSTREGEAVEINVTHSLDPAFVAAAELVRDRIVRQSIERAGDVIDVTPEPPAETV